jgi:hypothetical protein
MNRHARPVERPCAPPDKAVCRKGAPVTEKPTLPRDLGDGLRLRRSTRADMDRIAEFDATIFSEPPLVGPDPAIDSWVRDLLCGSHPTFGEDDFLLVEDTATGKVVSSTCWISQTWTYASPSGAIPFKVGRPEVVATDPAYRRRGLIRAQFEAFHEISAERGELVQAITGIPYYYRQFGYEMALDLGGGPACYAAAVPKLQEGEPEPFRLRPATDADAALFVALDAQVAQRTLVMCPRDEALWRYEISGRGELSADRLICSVVETADGAAAGGLAVCLEMENNRAFLPFLELLPGQSWLAAANSLLRAGWAEAEKVAAMLGRSLDAVQYGLGHDHPFYRVNAGRLMPSRRPWAWYIRVPDPKAFLRLIAPVLEARLADSAAANYTGDLLLSHFRSGLRISFDTGRIREIADWPPNDHECHAGFPDLTFTHLLFGHRSLDEMRHAFVDVTLDDRIGRPLLEALFPRQRSHFWAML